MAERRFRQAVPLIAVCASLVLTLPAAARETPAVTLDQVRDLRLEGALTEAIEQAERGLAHPRLKPDGRVALHLELARIHDRIGLHRNSRPVAAALRHIEAAEAAAKANGGDQPSTSVRAAITLARADYHYRARDYEQATPLADAAIRLFQQAGAAHGEADAVHKLGLIHFQRGDYARARELFDRSLELDREGGERLVFCGDYQRHVGFIHLRQDDTAAAIPYFERSLACRRAAGATDASLFAANTLASALIDAGRVEEARTHLIYAMMVAEKIDSPSGKARTGLVLGRMYDRENDPEAARDAYEMTLRIAQSINLGSIVRQCTSALEAGSSPAANRK